MTILLSLTSEWSTELALLNFTETLIIKSVGILNNMNILISYSKLSFVFNYLCEMSSLWWRFSRICG